MELALGSRFDVSTTPSPSFRSSHADGEEYIGIVPVTFQFWTGVSTSFSIHFWAPVFLATWIGSSSLMYFFNSEQKD